LGRHSAYGLDVGQAAAVAGIERSPSLVLLVEDILQCLALFCVDAVARMPSARFSHRPSSEWLENGI
jgi:hypothetical protein